MKEMINEALEGYEELKTEVDENPEEAREAFLEILNNPAWSMIGQDFSSIAEKVEELDLGTEQGIDEFRSLVDQLAEKVKL